MYEAGCPLSIQADAWGVTQWKCQQLGQGHSTHSPGQGKAVWKPYASENSLSHV